MNPVLREGAALAEHGWIMGVTTVLFIACFVGWTWWAYARKNRAMMEEAGALPLTTGDDRP